MQALLTQDHKTVLSQQAEGHLPCPFVVTEAGQFLTLKAIKVSVEVHLQLARTTLVGSWESNLSEVESSLE